MFDNNGRNNDKENGIFLTNRHISWLLSAFIITSFFVFISGYFLGQKRGVEKFSQKMDQENLADQIYSSMCALYDVNEELTSIDAEGESTETALSGEQEPEAVVEKSGSVAVAAHPESPAPQAQSVAAALVDEHGYCAQLIGFGSSKAAESFAAKLARKGIKVEVKKRQSKSAKGKSQNWYQVVTAVHATKAELEKIVSRIKHEEKIHDVCIVHC